MDLTFLYDVITLRAMDVYPKDSFLVRIFSENPFEVWSTFAGFWITALVEPRCVQMNDGMGVAGWGSRGFLR